MQRAQVAVACLSLSRTGASIFGAPDFFKRKLPTCQKHFKARTMVPHPLKDTTNRFMTTHNTASLQLMLLHQRHHRSIKSNTNSRAFIKAATAVCLCSRMGSYAQQALRFPRKRERNNQQQVCGSSPQTARPQWATTLTIEAVRFPFWCVKSGGVQGNGHPHVPTQFGKQQ